MLKSLLLLSPLLLAGCADAASPYYLDCHGQMQISDIDGRDKNLPIHWVFLIDETKGIIQSRDGEHGPFALTCDKGCEETKIDRQFVQWTVKVTDPAMPNFESHTQTQINRQTWDLAGVTWVGKDRDSDLSAKYDWAKCVRTPRPPTS